MGRVAGVLDDPPGFHYTPPGVDILEGGKLTSNNVAGSLHDPLQRFAVASGAVSKPVFHCVVTCFGYVEQILLRCGLFLLCCANFIVVWLVIVVLS